jgi:hypothetical protein
VEAHGGTHFASRQVIERKGTKTILPLVMKWLAVCKTIGLPLEIASEAKM